MIQVHTIITMQMIKWVHATSAQIENANYHFGNNFQLKKSSVSFVLPLQNENILVQVFFLLNSIISLLQKYSKTAFFY